MVVLHDLEPTGQHFKGVAVAFTGVLVNDENIRLSRMPERRLTTSRVVVVDISQLRLRNGVAPRFFSDALLRAGGWPEARLIVAGANPRLKATLTASGVARDVLLVRHVDDAHTYADVRPERVACRLYLTGCHTSIHRAAARVVSSAHAWGAPESIVDDALRVTSQLVRTLSDTLGQRASCSYRPTVKVCGSRSGTSTEEVSVPPADWPSSRA
jgi:hypothetical protein